MPAFQHPRLGRVLFLHVPKTGGSSVVKGLQLNGLHLDKIKPRIHPFYSQYQTWGSFSYKFMIVREPLDRFCSMLRYRQAPSRGGVVNSNLNAFAHDVLDKLEAGQPLDDLWRELIPPQVEYYGDDVEVFKLEDGFEALEEKLGLEIKIPRINVSDGTGNASHLSIETINRIKELYRDDYSTFGYEMQT